MATQPRPAELVPAPHAGAGRVRLRRIGRGVGESLFLLPAIALLAIVIFIPASIALFRSFFDWNPGYESPFAGLDNYRSVLSDEVFHEALKNQFFLLLGLPLWVLAPLCIAVLLYEHVPFAGVFRTIYFFPSVLAPAIVAIMFRQILAPDGTVNALLDVFGLGFLEQAWVNDPGLVKPTLIFVLAWAGMGTGVVIFAAALSAVPTELIESALVEGAGWWQRLRYILLPSIMPVVLFWTVFQVIAVFLWVFTWIYVLTRGGPGYSSTTTDFLIYNQVFRDGFFGPGAAMSVLLLGLVLTLVLAGWGVRALAQRRQFG